MEPSRSGASPTLGPGTQGPTPIPRRPCSSATDGLVTISSLTSAPPIAGTSPGALLAASLVRSRASYFERISSGSRASTSGSVQGGSPTGNHLQSSRATQSTALAAHPLHPLAPHPLCTLNRSGSGELKQQMDEDSDGGSDSDTEEKSADNNLGKPPYTRCGSNVELSAASTYRSKRADTAAGSATGAQAALAERDGNNRDSAGGDAGDDATGSPGGSAGGSKEQSSDEVGDAATTASPKTAELLTAGSSGYVRSMSARFGSMAGGSSGGGNGASGRGMDGLFDDLVAHVGALLASHPDVEAQMGMVQGLSDRLLELHALCETLGRKEDEVEHLRGVLRELTVTRADAIRLKVQMAESLNGLQQEYYKVLRSAQLAQGTCKQHSARAAATRKQLAEAQAELVRYKRAVGVLRDRNRRLNMENKDMAARLKVLEQAGLGDDIRRSSCYMTLVHAQTAVLY